jgi:Protein of unknown function (DUF2721)
MEPTETLITLLKSSISPIALISGVGLILLSLTNRLARTIDKSRMIVGEIESEKEADHKDRKHQLQVLFKRSKILRSSIVSISFSILCSSLIIPVLILMNMYHFQLESLGLILFLLSILGIVLSAIFLFADVTLTLKALKYEVKEYL